MKLLFIGASRGAGRLALEEALRRGHAVAALLRDVRSLAGASGVTAIEGDALDSAASRRGVAGQDAVITTLGPVGGSSPASWWTRWSGGAGADGPWRW